MSLKLLRIDVFCRRNNHKLILIKNKALKQRKCPISHAAIIYYRIPQEILYGTARCCARFLLKFQKATAYMYLVIYSITHRQALLLIFWKTELVPSPFSSHNKDLMIVSDQTSMIIYNSLMMTTSEHFLFLLQLFKRTKKIYNDTIKKHVKLFTSTAIC